MEKDKNSDLSGNQCIETQNGNLENTDNNNNNYNYNYNYNKENNENVNGNENVKSNEITNEIGNNESNDPMKKRKRGRPKAKEMADLLQLDKKWLPANIQLEKNNDSQNNSFLTEDEKKDILKKLRNMWEFSALFQWLFLFHKVIKINDDFSVELIEDILLGLEKSNDLLTRVRLGLIKNISVGVSLDTLDEYTQSQIIRKSKEYKYLYEDALDLKKENTKEQSTEKIKEENNTSNENKTKEIIKFSEFDLFDQVKILRALTSLQMINGEKFARSVAALDPDNSESDWRINPIGWDKDERIYYLLDDNRLYRMTINFLDRPLPRKTILKGKSKSKVKSKLKLKSKNNPKIVESNNEAVSKKNPSSKKSKSFDTPKKTPTRRSLRISNIPGSAPSYFIPQIIDDDMDESYQQPTNRRSSRIKNTQSEVNSTKDALSDEDIDSVNIKIRNNRKRSRRSSINEFLTDSDDETKTNIENNNSNTNNNKKKKIVANADQNVTSRINTRSRSQSLKNSPIANKLHKTFQAESDSESESIHSNKSEIKEENESEDENLNHKIVPDEESDVKQKNEDDNENDLDLNPDEFDETYVPEPNWECVCSSYNEWKSFLDSISSSKHADEKNLYSYLNEEVMPYIEEAEENRVKEELNRMKKRKIQSLVENRKRSSRVESRILRNKQLEIEEQQRKEEQRKREEERQEILRLRREAQKREKSLKERESRLRGRQLQIIRNKHGIKQDASDESNTDPNMAQNNTRRSLRRSSRARKSHEVYSGNWTFDCLCGAYGENYDDGKLSICCSRCEIWMHLDCLPEIEVKDIIDPRTNKVDESKDYYCEECRKFQRIEKEDPEQYHFLTLEALEGNNPEQTITEKLMTEKAQHVGDSISEELASRTSSNMTSYNGKEKSIELQSLSDKSKVNVASTLNVDSNPRIALKIENKLTNKNSDFESSQNEKTDISVLAEDHLGVIPSAVESKINLISEKDEKSASLLKVTPENLLGSLERKGSILNSEKRNDDEKVNSELNLNIASEMNGTNKSEAASKVSDSSNLVGSDRSV